MKNFSYSMRVCVKGKLKMSHLRETPRFPAALHLSHFSPPDRHRRVDSSALSGRVHDLRSTPQDEAGFMRKFETSHMGGAKC